MNATNRTVGKGDGSGSVVPMPSTRSSSVESFKVMDVLQRANQLQAAGHHVLHCEVGQPETGAPHTVTQGAIEALQQTRVMGYTDAFGLLPLRQKIADHYKGNYKVPVEVSTDNIAITTGSSGGFLLAFTACFDVGDVVAIASSGYPCYRNILKSLSCELASIGINHDFKVTATEVQDEIARRKEEGLKELKGLILSSPSNPTGVMLSPAELCDLCELCDRHNIVFLSDEIYHGVTYGKEEATALQYTKNAIVINSFSKYYSMSGWRLGWVILPDSLRKSVNALQQNMFICAPAISQVAALKCWDTDTKGILEEHVAKYRASREVILEELRRITELDPKNVAPADGGFYIYIDLGDGNVAPGFGSVAMCQALLEEKFVAFTPGNDFENPATDLGNRRFRISYAGGLDTVKMAMCRFNLFFPTWVKRVKEEKGKRVHIDCHGSNSE